MPDVFDHRYTEYQTGRSLMRQLVRRAYLRRAVSKLHGATLDFGCGVGDLLAMLPAGSKGLEYNKVSVDYCRSRGLDVDWYDGFGDDWRMSVLPDGCHFDSMIISHVLEHLEDPAGVLHRLLLASGRLGVDCTLIIVPGQSGFRIDATHKTFVDHRLLSDPAIVEGTGYWLESASYFPGDRRGIGDWFPHHELQVVFQRDGNANA